MKVLLNLLLLGIVACALPAESPPRGCSIITVSQGSQVFFAGNDDYHNRDSTYWVEPGAGSDYGVVFFGAPGNVQQGFNEVGLAYDSNSVPVLPVRDHGGTLPGPSSYSLYPNRILAECANVEEVIRWVETHAWHSAMHDQLHFADSSGDGVVVSVGADGQVAFTRKSPGDSYLVSTNFNVASPAVGDYASWRYGRSTRRAQELLDNRAVSADAVAEIMESVHIETRGSFTLYTVVGDLVEGTIDVYFMFQYDDPVTIDIRAQIAGGATSVPLSSLFPPAVVDEADAAYERLAAEAGRFVLAAVLWAAAVVVSFGLWLLDGRTRSLGIASLVMVIVLGPIGLLLSIYQSRSSSDTATVPALTSTSAVFVLAMVVLPALLVPPISNSQVGAIVLLVFAPIVVVLFGARAPLLAATRQIGYGSALLREAAPSLCATALHVAILLPLVVPLSLWALERSGSYLVSGTLVWAAAAGGSLIAMAVVWAGRLLFRRSERRWLRWLANTFLVAGAVVLLYIGLGLSQQTLQWLGPLIAGGPAIG